MDAFERLKVAIEPLVERHWSVDEAIEMAAAAVAELNDEEIQVLLLRRGLAAFVYDLRHHINERIWSANGKPPGDPKVVAAGSATMSAVGRAMSEYDLAVAGRVLGNIFGRELKELRDNELRKSDGHQRNAALFGRLEPLVPGEKTVRAAVSLKRLKRIFVEVQMQQPDSLAG